MKFVEHSELRGRHATFSGSNYHWLNYDDEKILTYLENIQAKERGTRLHNFAENAIKLGVRLDNRKKDTLSMYVNDCIKHHMQVERPLFFSENFFGFADAIKFDEKKKELLIFDLKTGATPAHFEQLLIYAAFFCLEYEVNPDEINIELRIYQNDDIIGYLPEPGEVNEIMALIVHFDNLIESEGYYD